MEIKAEIYFSIDNSRLEELTAALPEYVRLYGVNRGTYTSWMLLVKWSVGYYTPEQMKELIDILSIYEYKKPA